MTSASSYLQDPPLWLQYLSALAHAATRQAGMGHFHVPPDSQPSFWDVFELELWVIPAPRPFPLKLLCCEATLEGMAVNHYLLSGGRPYNSTVSIFQHASMLPEASCTVMCPHALVE